ncbi:major facilitator superfamily domain-containing protein [Emericellopsis atlantica]|uniref:Major facilitator superfamily domain-containing protein n=1 Tax=Emericellopsis atlantica TaxID=2614577 RepID=A0A9P7ZD76_9HYPO|nr:major facilitator superfamily domain-containing protein [Emericellopsis atlantica]KAG9249880.1 major facilitator superfamily domain-containing protein [Emericellopsis atlantica]
MAGLIAAAGFFVIPPPPPTVMQLRAGRKASLASVDWIGGAIITTGLLLLLFALTEGNVVGWSAPYIPVLIVVSVLIIVGFYFWQRHLESKGQRPPVVKVSMFKNRRFTVVLLIMGVFFASFNNYVIFATYFFQQYQGLYPLQTMLRFIPTGVGGAVVAFIVAKLMDKVPTVFIMLTGTISMSIACLLFSVPIPPSTSYFAWGLPAMLLAVIGADTTWPSLTLFTSRALPPEDQAIGGALINAVGQLGRAIGLAIATAVQTAVMADQRGTSVEDVGGLKEGDGPTLVGIRAANWLSFGLGIVSLILAPFAFRSLEIVGRAVQKRRPEAGGGEEGIMNEEIIETAQGLAESKPAAAK